MNIKFGRYKFTSPKKFEDFKVPKIAAIYAILIADFAYKPPFKVIYFGQSKDLSDRGFFKSHDNYDDWIKESGTEETLLISIHPMQRSSEEDRKIVENELISAFKPVCNEKKEGG